MEFGVVSRITEGFFRYQAWPTVAKDEKGVLYVGASSHRLGHVCPFGKDYLYISRDDGATWEGPIVVNDSLLDDRDAGLCAWGDGQLVLTWFHNKLQLYMDRRETEPGMRSPLSRAALELWNAMPPEEYVPGSFLRTSADGGKSWTEPVQVAVTSPHGPIRRADGSLLYLGKEFCSGDERLQRGNIYAFESRDGGASWEKLCHVEFPEGMEESDIHEPYAIELPDGTVLGALRVSTSKLPDRHSVATTFSYDGGRSFSKPQLLELCGTPPHMLLHSSGAVVLTYGRRKAPFGQRARISRDGGKTWGEELVISREAPDWDLGYPSSVELPDGTILTVYYQKFPGDGHTSIFYTKWRLEERL